MLFLVPSHPRHGLLAVSLTTNGISCRDVPVFGDPGDKELSHRAAQRRLCATESKCNSDDPRIKGICFPGIMRERC